MSNAIDSYYELYNNPFILAPLFQIFFGTLPLRPKGMLLSYLVLPLVLYPESRNYLLAANKRSHMRNLVEHRSRLFGLPRRVATFRTLTNLSVQHSINLGVLQVQEDLGVSLVGSRMNEAYCPKQTPKATRRLAQLLEPFDIPTVYRMVGVKRI